MIFIRTKSGRFMSLSHIVGFAIEEQIMEMEGKRVRVSNVSPICPNLSIRQSSEFTMIMKPLKESWKSS